MILIRLKETPSPGLRPPTSPPPSALGATRGLCVGGLPILDIFRKWNPEVWTPSFQLLVVIACAPSLSAGVDLPSFPPPAPPAARTSLHPSPVYMAPQPGPDCSVSSAGLAGTCQQVLQGDNSVRPVIGDVNLEPHSEDAKVTAMEAFFPLLLKSSLQGDAWRPPGRVISQASCVFLPELPRALITFSP